MSFNQTSASWAVLFFEALQSTPLSGSNSMTDFVSDYLMYRGVLGFTCVTNFDSVQKKSLHCRYPDINMTALDSKNESANKKP